MCLSIVFEHPSPGEFRLRKEDGQTLADSHEALAQGVCHVTGTHFDVINGRSGPCSICPSRVDAGEGATQGDLSAVDSRSSKRSDQIVRVHLRVRANGSNTRPGGVTKPVLLREYATRHLVITISKFVISFPEINTIVYSLVSSSLDHKWLNNNLSQLLTDPDPSRP